MTNKQRSLDTAQIGLLSLKKLVYIFLLCLIAFVLQIPLDVIPTPSTLSIKQNPNARAITTTSFLDRFNGNISSSYSNIAIKPAQKMVLL